MGATIAWGRDFAPDEDAAGKDAVAILGHAFAERRFSDPAAAVGQTITLLGRKRTVIGVLSRSFAFPGLTDIWIPLVIDPEMRANRTEARIIAFGRLKPGATLTAANEEVEAMAPRLAAEFPDTNRGCSAQVLNLPEVFLVGMRPVVLMTLVGALLTLFVAATNIGNILFAQGAARRAEFALRAALGAPRWRLVAQLLAECLVLCAIGGGLGLLLSMWGLDLFVTSMPEQVQNRMRLFLDPRFDGAWIAIAASLTLLTTLVAGLWPAWRTSDTIVAEALKEHGNHASSGRKHRRILRGLVTAQVAVALALLGGATSGALHLFAKEQIKLGFEPSRVLEALVVRHDEADEAGNTRFFSDWMKKMQSIPGVDKTGLASVTPLQRGNERAVLAVPGRPTPPAGEELTSHLTVVDGEYFAAAGIRLLEGNVFTLRDDRAAPAVAVLSRNAALRIFPGENAIGKTIIQMEEHTQTACRIIGIVDDVAAYHHPESGMVYRPFAQEPRAEMFALVRGSDPFELAIPVREAVHALDHSQAVETRPLQVHIDEFLWPIRTTVRLILVPAVLSVLLAVLGVYGVAAYSVTQRRPELGIRAALGAPPGALVRLVMGEALWIAGIGGTVGLGLAFVLSTGLHRALEMEVPSQQWVVLLSAVLLAIVLVASYGPAHRAARTAPSSVMRS
jgi:putative ABC transport system permease protein